MAQRYQPAGSAASGAHTLLKSLTGSDGAQGAYYAAGAAKSAEDIKRLQRQNQQGDAVRQGLIDGKPLADLQVLAGDNAELQGKLPEMWRARIVNDPHMTLEQKSAAIQGAGGSFSNSELGFQQHEAADTGRARIAAGPGYAAAAASRYGHDLSYRAAHDRLVQDEHHWTDDPKPVYDPATNTTRWVHQGDLATLPPGPNMPFSPEAYTGANKPTSYSRTPGDVPVLARSADLTTAFMQPNAPAILAPTPESVQVERVKPLQGRMPGATEDKYYPAGAVTDRPGLLAPPPKEQPAGPAPPQPANLPANSDYLAEQALRGQFNLAAGLSGQGFQKGDLGAAGPNALPPEIEKRLPEFRTQVQRYAQLNNLNFDDAAWQVMRETYGTPTASPQGQQGFNIQLPTYRSLWLAGPTVTPGTPVPPRPVTATGEGHQQITPQATRPGAKPAGPEAPLPPSPTAALTPPMPPAPVYAPAGTQPVPTIRLGGNPAPAPVPPPPPAPAPARAPAAAATPAPNEIIAHAQAAIAAGADAAAVTARLKKDFNLDLPPPPAPVAPAPAPGP